MTGYVDELDVSFFGNSRADLVASLRKRFSKDMRLEMYQKLISWYNKE